MTARSAFRPELLNRIDEIVVFRALGLEILAGKFKEGDREGAVHTHLVCDASWW